MFKELLINDLHISVKDKRKKQVLSKAIRENSYCFRIAPNLAALNGEKFNR